MVGVRQEDQKRLNTIRTRTCCLIIAQVMPMVNSPFEAGFQWRIYRMLHYWSLINPVSPIIWQNPTQLSAVRTTIPNKVKHQVMLMRGLAQITPTNLPKNLCS